MSEASGEKWNQYRIPDVPESMLYIPNFLTAEEEEAIWGKIPPQKWISLSHRRLQALPARLTASNTLIASAGLPDWLTQPTISRRSFEELDLFENSPHGQANHCLINEYLPGQGILPHEDGAAYWPVVATVSLGGAVVLDVTEKKGGGEGEQRRRWRILQERRSLLVTMGSAYRNTLHGIAEVGVDVDLNEMGVANWRLLGDREGVGRGRNERGTRVSLTFRDVVKVANVGAKIFGRAKA